VASAVGGLRELVTDGRDGLLVPAGDARALARCVTTVLADPDLAARLGEQARRRVAGQDWQALGARVLEVYRGVAGR
jgi:glycosyltransferase involved in cell wall biosynthesis